MSSIFYTAKRSIKSGHTIDTDYSFDRGMSVLQRKPTADRITRKSRSGLRGHWLNNIDEIWDFTTTYIQIGSSEHLDMIEFLDSCLGGETFSIDPYGTIAVPVSEFDAQLESTSYVEQRLDTTDFITISFTARKL